MFDDGRIQASVRSAKAVLDMAEANQIAPTPQIFEVLLCHIEGRDNVISASVAAALQLTPDKREEILVRLYDEKLGPAALHAGLARISRGLTTEIADVSIQITESLKGNLDLASEMRRCLRELAEQLTKEDVRSLCKGLATSNKLHLASTQNTALQLERTQHQLSDMRRELTHLRNSATTDYLTGLPNRRYLDEKLFALFADRTPFSFAMFDLDHFKRINDTWGHSAGDNILRRLGELLRQNTKGKDMACRVGGEEFALILPETDIDGAEILCRKISLIFNEINWISASTEEDIGTLSLSGGVTMALQQDTPGTIYDRADGLLYEAKSQGRNRIIKG